MLRDNLFIIVILFMVSIMAGGYWVGWAVQVEDMDGDGYKDWYAGMGIYDAPSKQAVYVQGTSCTINMDPERTNQYDLARDFEFCKNQHMKLYKDHTP